MSDAVVHVTRAGHVATIHLNRPTKLNAVNQEIADGLSAALDEVERDSDVRVVVLQGEGRSFCVGADLSALAGIPPEAGVRWVKSLSETQLRMQRFGKPTIARIHGHALGLGCSLTLTCDFAVATETAIMGLPEVEHGLVPGVSMVFLKPLVNSRTFLDLIMTGRRFNGREAQALGLVNQAVPAEDLDAAVAAIASRLAELSPSALRLSKRLYHDMAELHPAEQLTAAQDVVLVARTTADAGEGALAFKEKRPPQWSPA